MKVLRRLKRKQGKYHLHRDSITSAHFSRNDGQLASTCLDREESIPFGTFRRLLLRLFFARFVASSCNRFAIIHVFVVCATMRLERRLPMTVFSHVSRRLTQECCLPVPCPAAGIDFVPGMSHQYGANIGKHFWISLSSNETASLLPLVRLIASVVVHMALPSIANRFFCGSLQDFCGIHFSRDNNPTILDFLKTSLLLQDLCPPLPTRWI